MMHGRMEVDEAMWAQIDREITEFNEWHAALQQDLSYLMTQPATDENIQKIGETVDYYFSDLQFGHEDHDVRVERTPDGGLAITVSMKYDSADQYYDDFLMEPEMDFMMLIEPDTGDEIVMPELSFVMAYDFDPVDAEQMAMMIEDEARAQQAEDEFFDEVEKFFARMAESDAAVPPAPTPAPEIINESPDDILFAPITTPEKKPEPTPDIYYDCG